MPPRKKLTKKTVSKATKQPEVDELETVAETTTGLRQIDPVEAERWGRLDAEIRIAMLSREVEVLKDKILELEEKARREQVIREEEARRAQFNETRAKLHEKMKSFNQQAVDLKPSYDTLCRELAEKYNIPKERMLLDPDLRTIRDSSELDV